MWSGSVSMPGRPATAHRLSQVNHRDLETGANGVDDCGFHRSSLTTSTGRGRTVATLRQYMKVDFEGKLHIWSRQTRALLRGEDGQVRTQSAAGPVDQAVISAQLRAVSVGLVRRLRSTASPGELTWSQESALLRLEIGGPQTISQLARAEGTRSQSMGAIVASLEAQGLADRTPDSSDGRQSIITVSDAGRRALDDARAVKQDWLAERLTDLLTQDEQNVIAQAIPLLQRIIDLTSDTPAGGPQ
jgi:DNA-binding MarR family transcriptional regulator